MVNLKKKKSRNFGNTSGSQQSHAGKTEADDAVRPSEIVKHKLMMGIADHYEHRDDMEKNVDDSGSDDNSANGQEDEDISRDADGYGHSEGKDSKGEDDISPNKQASSYMSMKSVKIADEVTAMKQHSSKSSGMSSRKSGFGILFSDNLAHIHHEDFDAGVNAMALLCALVLSIPFEIVGNLDYDNLDRMKELFDLCQTDELGFHDVYATYRGSFLATVYWAIAGMILGTFYFLFKRMDDESYKQWRWKARWLVVSMFFSTAFAICSLILLTNMYFDYYLLSANVHNICSNNTLRFVMPGLLIAVLAFFWAIYLVW